MHPWLNITHSHKKHRQWKGEDRECHCDKDENHWASNTCECSRNRTGGKTRPPRPKYPWPPADGVIAGDFFLLLYWVPPFLYWAGNKSVTKTRIEFIPCIFYFLGSNSLFSYLLFFLFKSLKPKQATARCPGQWGHQPRRAGAPACSVAAKFDGEPQSPNPLIPRGMLHEQGRSHYRISRQTMADNMG